MNVLLVEPWGGGGISVFYANLAKYLAGKGVTVDAFCYMRTWPDADLLRPHCRHIHPLGVSLTEAVTAEHYDVVHVSVDALLPPLGAPEQLRRGRFRGRLIVTAHHLPGGTRIPLDRVDALVAVSPTTAARLEDQGARDVIVVPNGVDRDEFNPSVAPRTDLATRRPILGWVGRADDLATKDVNGFLYVAGSLLESRYEFVVVDGSSEGGDAMRKLPDWFGDRVRRLHRPSRSGLAAFYRTVAASGGAILLTSTQEACPLVVLEAWATGCPTIVPRVPGLEHAEAREASMVYDRHAAVDEVGRLMVEMEDAEVRQRLVANGYSAIEEQFNLEQMGDAYLRLYGGGGGARGDMAVVDRAVGRLWALAYRGRRLVKDGDLRRRHRHLDGASRPDASRERPRR